MIYINFFSLLPFRVFKNNPFRPSACPRWTHGAGCSQECNCVQEHSSGCDPKTGSCLCKAAYHGPQCDKGNKDKRTKSLTKPLQVWRNRSTSSSSVSSSSCVSNSECDPGFFGAGCEESCDCPTGGLCNPRTGECRLQCPAGLYGNQCQLGETILRS